MADHHEPVLVDAEPQRKLGDVAVWDILDIPSGVLRAPAVGTVAGAAQIAKDSLRVSCFAGCLEPHKTLTDGWARGWRYAAVRWADLQPRDQVPRGRHTMTIAQWGTDRDEHGVCRACGADDSMWCDTVAHDQANQADLRACAAALQTFGGNVPEAVRIVNKPAEPDPRASCIRLDDVRRRTPTRRLRPDETPVLVDREFENWE